MGTFRSVLAPAAVSVYAAGRRPEDWPQNRAPLPDTRACTPVDVALQDVSLMTPDPNPRTEEAVRFKCAALTVALQIRSVNAGARDPRRFVSDDGVVGPAVGLSEVTFYYRP